MKIIIQPNNFEITDSIKEFIFTKFQLLTKIIHHNESECLITLGKISAHHKQGDIFKVSVRVKNNKDIFQIEEIHEDIYAAIDIAKDTMERAIVVGRERKRSVFRKAAIKFKQLLQR